MRGHDERQPRGTTRTYIWRAENRVFKDDTQDHSGRHVREVLRIHRPYLITKRLDDRRRGRTPKRGLTSTSKTTSNGQHMPTTRTSSTETPSVARPKHVRNPQTLALAPQRLAKDLCKFLWRDGLGSALTRKQWLCARKSNRGHSNCRPRTHGHDRHRNSAHARCASTKRAGSSRPREHVLLEI